MNDVDHVEALFEQALAQHQQGLLAAAGSGYRRVLELQPKHSGSYNYLGILALQNNDPKSGAALLGQAIALDPGNAVAYINHASACTQIGQHEAAIASYDKAIALEPECAALAWYSRGNALNQLRRYAAALLSYDEAIALESADADAYYGRGIALHELGDPAAAVASYERAIALETDYAAQAHYGRGLALLALGQLEAAAGAFDAAVKLQPNYPEAWLRHAATLHQLRDFAAALASYGSVLALRPADAEAYNGRGALLIELRQFDAAIANLDRAIALAPADARTHNHRGIALAHLKRHEAAIASFDSSIALSAENADAHRNRGVCLIELRQFEAAIASFDRAISLDSTIPGLRGMRLSAKAQICDWRGLDEDVAALSGEIERGEAAAPPFNFLALSPSAPLQRQAAENWGRKNFPANATCDIPPHAGVRDRIRIGYFSSDFRDHATLYLMAGLFEKHDASAFEVTAFSYGRDSQDAMRRRLAAACRVIDVRGQSDREIALLARTLGLEVAIDLNGYTHSGRPGIFAFRAAPLQVSYLGYPGTLGVDYMDYLVADATVVPTESQRYYTEKIVYLPHSYQVNDDRRAIADIVPTRAALGLPSTGFVFCCFNSTYKIKPETFATWMSILRRVEGSVLWLFADNPSAVENLRGEAERQGLAGNRLIFAARVDMPEHLARHRAADLFLDTLPYNAHTTASDALWAGLPVLTCMAEAFAGRVAASLLRALDLPELVASDRLAYEDLAVELALNPQRLGALRRKLLANRESSPLFDTARSTRYLEAAYRIIVERQRAQLPPEHVYVQA